MGWSAVGRTVLATITIGMAVALPACGGGDEADRASPAAVEMTTAETEAQETAEEATTEEAETGEETVGGASPERAAEIEACLQDAVADVGGLNTPVTDYAFLINISEAEVYVFGSAEEAEAAVAEIRAEYGFDDENEVKVVGESVVVYQHIHELAGGEFHTEEIESCLE